MDFSIAMVIGCEMLVAAFLLWGFWHEDRFVSFEHKVAVAIRKRFGKKKKAGKQLRIVSGKNEMSGHDYTAA